MVNFIFGTELYLLISKIMINHKPINTTLTSFSSFSCSKWITPLSLKCFFLVSNTNTSPHSPASALIYSYSLKGHFYIED